MGATLEFDYGCSAHIFAQEHFHWHVAKPALLLLQSLLLQVNLLDLIILLVDVVHLRIRISVLLI